MEIRQTISGRLVQSGFNISKLMDKMSKEETLQAMKDIRLQYGDSVIVEFSGDGMAALVEGKGAVDAAVTPEQKEAQKTKNEAFQKEIKYNDNSLETVEGEYLLHGIKRIETTNVPDMMRTMDREAYSEYEKTLKRNDGGVSSLKYLINWYTGAVEKNPSLVAEYEKQLKFSRNIFSGPHEQIDKKLFFCPVNALQ